MSRGVYAVGRLQLTQHGLWMAAVLSCGPSAVLSHASAGALLGLRPGRNTQIEISVPFGATRRRPGMVVHRRRNLTAEDITVHQGIPVTTPACTLIDLAGALNRGQLERAINEADGLDLIDPERLRSVLEEMPQRPGLAVLRKTLDRRTFCLTDSELERVFIPIARRAGLDKPLTQQYVNDVRVDFYWPDLGLVEKAVISLAGNDGSSVSSPPVGHGMTPSRVTCAQAGYEPKSVTSTLAAVAARLR